MNGKGAPVDPRRSLPSVDSLLGRPELEPWVIRRGRATVTQALRGALEKSRDALSRGGAPPTEDGILRDALTDLEADVPSLRPVLNGTGVVLHTNLGRAPLARAAAEAAASTASSYSNLEYEVESGGRGDRYTHCSDLLCRLTGSEDALVVNNNAAAVSLAINELARGRDVVVSRGELVEIGGGFRIPEVIERSGGFLAAVGTTNKSRIADYRNAITPSTGLLLKVHPSNYRIQGFTEQASLKELVELGRRAGIPVLHDTGSGPMLPDVAEWLGEPLPAASEEAGADLITWSGDKLLGGPQAGLLHGRRELVSRLRSNPLLRAFRVDKMTLAALEATLRVYLDPDRAIQTIPALRMLSATEAEIEKRASTWWKELPDELARRVHVVALTSVVGGGSAPGREIPSVGWAIDGPAEALDEAFRGRALPLVGRIVEDRFTIDFRTVLPGEEPAVVEAVTEALEPGAAG